MAEQKACFPVWRARGKPLFPSSLSWQTAPPHTERASESDQAKPRQSTDLAHRLTFPDALYFFTIRLEAGRTDDGSNRFHT